MANLPLYLKMQKKIFTFNDRVTIDKGLPSERNGNVAGKCQTRRYDSHKTVTLYAIELDRGFYDDGLGHTFVSILLVHPDCLTFRETNNG